MSSTLNALAAMAYLLVLAGSLLAMLRAFSAVFSSRVRASIGRHPIVHAVWFVIAVIVLYDLLSMLSASHGRRSSLNHPVSSNGAITLLFQKERTADFARCLQRSDFVITVAHKAAVD